MHMRAPGCKLGILAVAVVLVEGISDQLALEALAARRGLNLDAEGIAIVPMGGSKNIKSFLDRFGPQGLNLRLAGPPPPSAGGAFPPTAWCARCGAHPPPPQPRRPAVCPLLPPTGA